MRYFVVSEKDLDQAAKYSRTGLQVSDRLKPFFDGLKADEIVSITFGEGSRIYVPKEKYPDHFFRLRMLQPGQIVVEGSDEIPAR